jgi:uncharacterized protein (DUF58 family)
VGFFLTSRFFITLTALIVLFACAFFWEPLMRVAEVAFLAWLGLVSVDLLLVSRQAVAVGGDRYLPPYFSLGEENAVRVTLTNTGFLPVRIRLIDELPEQLQVRHETARFTLMPRQTKQVDYTVRPLVRGRYHYGVMNVFVATALRLVEKRKRAGQAAALKVYPSVMQMKRFELRTLNRIARFQGVKKMRKIGHSYEFEQIKTYVPGDDYRSVNWKATGRHGGELMVNQYEDERAQQVYTIIDKSRSMKLPFSGLSPMDHAINTALVISNVALQKTDRPGLITFAERIDTIVHAQSNARQMPRILEALYTQRESDLEANFELLYRSIRNQVKGRSLLILMTNFETLHGMQRAKALLRRISRLHLLVVVFFENTEIADFSRQPAEDLDAIYHQTIARKFLSEKRRMVTELENYGIKAVLTRPEELTVHVINAYLELKARGMI